MLELSRRQAALAAMGALALAAPTMAAAAEAGADDSLDALRALLAAHNKAFPRT